MPKSNNKSLTLALRKNVKDEDKTHIRAILESSGYFKSFEIDTALELVDERLFKGLSSGYHFLLVDKDGRTVGFACYGPIACTEGSYDLYWIAVAESYHGQGIGGYLLGSTENHIRFLGGQRIYIETSGRADYEDTRRFYLQKGYIREAVLPDFYTGGDDKYIYCKRLPLAGT